MGCFCKACGKVVEWHPTMAGAKMPIDPDAHPDGHFAFNHVMRLVRMARGAKPRMYHCHWDTCARNAKPERRGCELDGCERTDRHLHCYRCHATDHLADDCDEAA